MYTRNSLRVPLGPLIVHSPFLSVKTSFTSSSRDVPPVGVPRSPDQDATTTAPSMGCLVSASITLPLNVVSQTGVPTIIINNRIITLLTVNRILLLFFIFLTSQLLSCFRENAIAMLYNLHILP